MFVYNVRLDLQIMNVICDVNISYSHYCTCAIFYVSVKGKRSVHTINAFLCAWVSGPCWCSVYVNNCAVICLVSAKTAAVQNNNNSKPQPSLTRSPSMMRCHPRSLHLYLLVCCCMESLQAEVLLIASLPEHEGSVAIGGENMTCRSAGEAALRCDHTDNCRGIWYYDNGRNKSCQAAVCPGVSGRPELVPRQSGLFFLNTGVFTTGKTINKSVVHTHLYMYLNSAYA